MEEKITISLPDEVKAALDKAIEEEGLSQNEIVSNALRDYLFVRKFRLLRERMTVKNQDAYTDQDIFDRVS